ncbi:Activated RNA polymerase II transcriptional coactivator p15 [Vanrija pseudolonga]|uniref:Activated RNA polymerase II transcriptional coactivator p15 n=1 Tax=Vanrija pseudolonga TaxID=143232 RepID=A0AAF0Y038_9TREE|nr:Activated RNA polymerase II transcriptional coactivator p15 [Vanrija pseudolonga]
MSPSVYVELPRRTAKRRAEVVPDAAEAGPSRPWPKTRRTASHAESSSDTDEYDIKSEQPSRGDENAEAVESDESEDKPRLDDANAQPRTRRRRRRDDGEPRVRRQRQPRARRQRRRRHDDDDNDSYGEEDDEQPPARRRRARRRRAFDAHADDDDYDDGGGGGVAGPVGIRTNPNGDQYIQLAPYRHVTLRVWQGETYVDIRNFYRDRSGELAPTTKGISLTPEQWALLRDNVGLVDEMLGAAVGIHL